jgi:hypothetical protein
VTGEGVFGAAASNLGRFPGDVRCSQGPATHDGPRGRTSVATRVVISTVSSSISTDGCRSTLSKALRRSSCVGAVHPSPVGADVTQPADEACAFADEVHLTAGETVARAITSWTVETRCRHEPTVN